MPNSSHHYANKCDRSFSGFYFFFIYQPVYLTWTVAVITAVSEFLSCLVGQMSACCVIDNSCTFNILDKL